MKCKYIPEHQVPNILDSGYVYAPYVPLIQTPVVYTTSAIDTYSKTTLPREFYAKVKVTFT
jgi:hypothetical protein